MDKLIRLCWSKVKVKVTVMHILGIQLCNRAILLHLFYILFIWRTFSEKLPLLLQHNVTYTDISLPSWTSLDWVHILSAFALRIIMSVLSGKITVSYSISGEAMFCWHSKASRAVCPTVQAARGANTSYLKVAKCHPFIWVASSRCCTDSQILVAPGGISICILKVPIVIQSNKVYYCTNLDW